MLLLALALQAAAPPKIRYSKDFPGSVPAYVSVWIDQSGSGEFTDSPGGEQPVRLQLDPSETAAIFSLAGKLDNFSRPLESGLKVAFTGTKVFRYEGPDATREVKFNYSADHDALALADWFERITETALHLINLERTAKFDRLGLDKALLQLQISADRGRLVGARQLLPILDRVVANKLYFNRVRERASALADVIRANQGGAK